MWLSESSDRGVSPNVDFATKFYSLAAATDALKKHFLGNFVENVGYGIIFNFTPLYFTWNDLLKVVNSWSDEKKSQMVPGNIKELLA